MIFASIPLSSAAVRYPIPRYLTVVTVARQMNATQDRNLVLNRYVTRVGLLAVHDLHDMGDEQRIALVVELERTATAFEADLRQCIANRGAIGLAGRFDRQDGHGGGVIGFRCIGVRVAAIGLSEFRD